MEQTNENTEIEINDMETLEGYLKYVDREFTIHITQDTNTWQGKAMLTDVPSGSSKIYLMFDSVTKHRAEKEQKEFPSFEQLQEIEKKQEKVKIIAKFRGKTKTGKPKYQIQTLEKHLS